MALPNQLKAARMSNATAGDTIDDNVGALETALSDILGIPIDTNISAALFAVIASGLKTIKLQDGSADPAAAGEIGRNGTEVRVHTGGAVMAIGIPVGSVVDYAGASAPSGWLLCDGSAVSRTTYADLFAAIGTTWGVGDGSTTFNIPDMRRRVAVGSGGTGTGTLGNATGNTGGAETHTLTTTEMPAHSHVIHGDVGGVAGASLFFLNGTGSSPLDSSPPTNPANTGGSGAHNNMQPSAVVTKIIKV